MAKNIATSGVFGRRYCLNARRHGDEEEECGKREPFHDEPLCCTRECYIKIPQIPNGEKDNFPFPIGLISCGVSWTMHRIWPIVNAIRLMVYKIRAISYKIKLIACVRGSILSEIRISKSVDPQ